MVRDTITALGFSYILLKNMSDVPIDLIVSFVILILIVLLVFVKWR